MTQLDLRAPDRLDPLLADLRGRIAGRVIGPDDRDYDAARTVVYGGIDHHPIAIARVRDSADVAAVLAFAGEHGLPVSVRSGGHGALGLSVVDDGIVIDVRAMNAIDVDVDGRVAWVETGCTALEVSNALAEHGLAIGFGDTGSVGVGGITLGGGVGYLVRKFGLTIDSLLAAELVLADGSVVLASDVEHPDLFWGIRGGGGNFGVATRYRFRLSEVPSFVGGSLVIPATEASLTGFMAAAEAAPEELSLIANVMPCPPLPFVEPEHYGRNVIFALCAFAGSPDAAAEAYAPLRATGPIADLVQPMPYPGIYPPEDDEYHPLAVARNFFMDRFEGRHAAAILAALDASDAPVRAAQLRVLGGASARVANEATAYAHRDRNVMVNVASFYVGEEDRPRREAWVDALWQSLAAPGDLTSYVNFMADEGEERRRGAFPHGTWERLRAVKRRYDPDNIFRGNQNIPPAEPGSSG